MKYKKFEDLPIHAFENKECTKTPSPELREYLWYMLEHHEQDLAYIWRYSQQYYKHGGCYLIGWERWLEKLRRDLKSYNTKETE